MPIEAAPTAAFIRSFVRYCVSLRLDPIIAVFGSSKKLFQVEAHFSTFGQYFASFRSPKSQTHSLLLSYRSFDLTKIAPKIAPTDERRNIALRYQTYDLDAGSRLKIRSEMLELETQSLRERLRPAQKQASQPFECTCVCLEKAQ